MGLQGAGKPSAPQDPGWARNRPGWVGQYLRQDVQGRSTLAVLEQVPEHSLQERAGLHSLCPGPDLPPELLAQYPTVGPGQPCCGFTPSHSPDTPIQD